MGSSFGAFITEGSPFESKKGFIPTFLKFELLIFAIIVTVMKFSILLIFGAFSCVNGSPISTELSENEGKVYSCQIKQEQCQFATVAPVYYTTCKNDDTICSGGGGESDPCEGDSPDPEEMEFCTAKMPEISDLTDAQKPWVLCSEDCFVGSNPKNYTETTGCAAKVRQCKFPFIFNDKEYTECTNDLLFESDYDDRTEESFKWCATSTNSDGSMKKGKWGRCDEATCKWESQASRTPTTTTQSSTTPTTTAPTTTTQSTAAPTSAAPAPKYLSCVGVAPWNYLIGMDWWCTLVCNHVPIFCPESHCACN